MGVIDRSRASTSQRVDGHCPTTQPPEITARPRPVAIRDHRSIAGGDALLRSEECCADRAVGRIGTPFLRICNKQQQWQAAVPAMGSEQASRGSAACANRQARRPAGRRAIQARRFARTDTPRCHHRPLSGGLHRVRRTADRGDGDGSCGAARCSIFRADAADRHRTPRP